MNESMNKGRWYIKLLMSLLVILGGWSLVSLVRLGLLNALSTVGLTQEWMQHVAIIILVLVLFTILGLSFKNSLKKMMGK